MKCKYCNCCRLGWFSSKPDKYACIGVPEPFIIEDIDVECTEYSKVRNEKSNFEFKDLELNGRIYSPYINDDGVYIPVNIHGSVYYQLIISKEIFVEAYNKWIKGEETND